MEADKEKQAKMRIQIAKKVCEHYSTPTMPENITDCDGCKANTGRMFSGCTGFVEVSFYRRSLSTIFKALTDARFYITYISEGKPTKELKSISGEDYKRLTKKPFFLFVKCQKIK